MSDYPPGMTLRPIDRWPFEFTKTQAPLTVLRNEQVRQAGNAVTPPAARDLVGVVAESLGAA